MPYALMTFRRSPFRARQNVLQSRQIRTHAQARRNAVEPQAQTSHGPRVAVIAALNEDRFIGSVVLKARHYVDHVIVVDDGSHDQTATVAAEAGAIVLRHEYNQGKAQAVNTGLRKAREMNAALVVLIDADGQHDPAEIPALIAPIEAGVADMVVGSRFLGVRNRIPRWRILGQHALTLVTNLASGITITDSQSGFRALSQRAINAMSFRPEGGFSLESEMQFLAQQHHLTVHEVPVSVTYAERPKRNPFSHGLQVLNGIVVLVSQHRPLVFFGVPGLLILIAGILLGVVVVQRYNTYQTLAVGTALISLLLSLIGIQTLFTGIILHSIRALLTPGDRE